MPFNYRNVLLNCMIASLSDANKLSKRTIVNTELNVRDGFSPDISFKYHGSNSLIYSGAKKRPCLLQRGQEVLFKMIPNS